MSSKRSSVSVVTEIIEKYIGTDFDKVSTIEGRIAAIEAIVTEIDDLDTLILAANDITDLISNVSQLYVTNPLLDNPVDFAAEGFPEDTLGSFLAAVALVVKLNETAHGDNLTSIGTAATAEGTSYPPLAGGWDPALVTVEDVLSSLRSTFTRTGTIVVADDATQTTPYAYVAPATLVNISNDKAGARSSTDNAPVGVTNIYHVPNDHFLFSGFNIGDVLTIRVDLDITPTIIDQTVEVWMKSGEGDPAEKIELVTREKLGAVAQYNVVGEITIVLDSAAMLSEEAHLQFLSDANAAVITNTFTVFANVKS